MSKVCNSCLVDKEVSEFYKQTNGNLRGDCKECAKLKIKLRYQKDPQLQIDRVMSSFKKKPEYYRLKVERFSSQGRRFFCAFAIKPVILERDLYSCQLCHTTVGNLQLHHINPVQYDETDAGMFNPQNLVTLCKACHLKAHKGAFKNLDTSLAVELRNLVSAKEMICETKLPEFKELILASAV